MSKLQSSILALLFLTGSILMLMAPAVFGATLLGDTNIEPVGVTFQAQYVEALTKITVTQPTTIQSVSMYIQYGGSGSVGGSGPLDGLQCLKFGIYTDNGAAYGQSSPLNEPLIAATQNGYCFGYGNFGPAWETWKLQSSDYLTISQAGTYWLAVLPKQNYGTIYRFTYTGLYPYSATYPGQSLYNYGYYVYGFPASYALGFPPVPFGAFTLSGYLIVPKSSAFEYGYLGDYNAPYSFYATGT
jgi:hypothetical protein